MSDEKTLYVEGMHCASCEFYLEHALRNKAGVRTVKASLKEGTVTLECDGSQSAHDLARDLAPYVQDGGYRLHSDRPSERGHRDLLYAVPLAGIAILAYLFVQRLGVFDGLIGEEMSVGGAMLVGVIASFSTCLAVVGGLVLSLGARAAQQGSRWTSQFLFHAGRLVGFFVLGGIIGALGQVFQLGIVGNAVLTILVALVMLTLGLQLIDVHPRLRGLAIKMPRVFAERAKAFSASSGAFVPLLLGGATFFLPCGFTQSMQVYTLTTGGFWEGGMTMAAFALGTLPVLALLSFGAFEATRFAWKGIFFKTVGLVILALSLVNLEHGVRFLLSL